MACGLTLILDAFEKLAQKHEVEIRHVKGDIQSAAVLKLVATAHNDARWFIANARQ